MPSPPHLADDTPFATASEIVVEHLKDEVPLAFWSVTRRAAGRQVYLTVRDDAYGTTAGDSCDWSDTFCQYAVTGATPGITTDAMAVPEYAAVAARRNLKIGTYVGIPIRGADGGLFGTLCGLDPWSQPVEFRRNAPLLDLCASVLGQVLNAEGRHAEQTAPRRPAGLQLEGPLRHAVDHGSIEAFHQPIVDLFTDRVVGFEALARWRHDGEVIGPDVFVPIATRSGLLPALTDHMIELAAAQIARWSGHPRFHDVNVAVNVSPNCFTDPAFPDRVAASLGRHRVPGRLLTIEITEDALIDDLPTAVAVSRRLRAMGVSLVLDDFGTGYSAMAHLRWIPLTAMKIDRGFARDIDTDPEAERFLQALLTLGRDVGLHVVTEGIERPGQAAALRRNGGRFAQGYLFGAPAPPGA